MAPKFSGLLKRPAAAEPGGGLRSSAKRPTASKSSAAAASRPTPSPKSRVGIGCFGGPRGGSPEYSIATAKLLPGPSTAHDLAAWPLDVLNSILEPGVEEDGDGEAVARTERLRANIFGAIVSHTDYSGWLTVETTYRILGLALERFQFSPMPQATPENPFPWLVQWRCCDSNAVCQSIALHNKYECEHVIESLEARTPRKFLDQMNDLKPAPTDSKEVKAAAYAKMKDVLVKNKGQIFHPESTAKCLKHSGCRCPLAWKEAHGLLPSRRPLRISSAGTVSPKRS